MGKFIDLTGQRYGRLTVLAEAGKKGVKRCWLCKCDCGSTTVVMTTSLRSGNTQSCGCYKAEHPGRLKHGGCGTKLYRIYKNIKLRCYNERFPDYKHYGGRGIAICDEWLHSFESFRDWAIANGYHETNNRSDCTIDRIDVNGDYCPENCRWVTQKTQVRNTRRTRKATCNGVTKPIGEWAEEWNLPYNTVYDRAKKNGWTLNAP